MFQPLPICFDFLLGDNVLVVIGEWQRLALLLCQQSINAKGVLLTKDEQESQPRINLVDSNLSDGIG